MGRNIGEDTFRIVNCHWDNQAARQQAQGNALGFNFNQDVVSAEKYFALQAQVRQLEGFVQSQGQENERLASQVATLMAKRGGMLRQTEIALELFEKMQRIAELLEGITWRKRRVDSEKECVACGVLRSAFGGHHAPSCWIDKVQEAAKLDPQVEKAWRAMKCRELGPQAT